MVASLLDPEVNKGQINFLEITYQLVTVPMPLVCYVSKQAGVLVRTVAAIVRSGIPPVAPETVSGSLNGSES
nr:hypothetical protein [Tanacetum cinerariifolium]